MPKIKYKEYYINYEIKYTKPKKSVSIKLKYPDIIQVFAPSYITEKEINDLVLSKCDWILNKLNDFKNNRIENCMIKFEDNAKIPFLGEYFDLKIIKSDKILNCKFEFDKEKFIAYVPTFMNSDIYAKELKYLFKDWLIFYGTNIVKERISIYSQKLNVSPKKIKVKEQNTTWGTCSSLGNIYINYKILLAPVNIIDYVIVHELCHLKEMNHSKKFWYLVENVIPDYKLKKQWLKENGFRLNI